MDLTPIVPAGRQVIESYGPAGFRVTGILHRGSILVFPDATFAWPVRDLTEVTMATLAPVSARGGIEVLLLGCGVRMQPVAPELRRELKAVGIVVDAMDTGAACRTYNVLMAEDRRVAAALLALEIRSPPRS